MIAGRNRGAVAVSDREFDRYAAALLHLGVNLSAQRREEAMEIVDDLRAGRASAVFWSRVRAMIIRRFDVNRETSRDQQ